MSENANGPMIEDAPPAGPILRRAPDAARPWLQLMRADRPIGTWLLLLPCWQGLALAATTLDGAASDRISLAFWPAVAFAVGATAMRGAGCALNDIVDRHFDRAVLRTQNRPIASGRISVAGGGVFALLLCVVGGAVLLTLGPTAIWVGLAALVPASLYPFAKRLTWWPQALLGVAFNWGALVGWAAAAGPLSAAPLLLYAGGIFWTLGYDTVYALMDRDDDRRIGVRSTALLFAERTRSAVAAFYLAATGLAAAAGVAADLGPFFWPGLAVYGLHFAWQVHRLRPEDRGECLRLFRSNRDAGLLLLLAVCLGGIRP